MSKISVSIKRKKPVRPDIFMPVYLQIIYRRKVARIPLGVRIAENEWNDKDSSIQIPPDAQPDRVLLLHAMKEKLKEKQEYLLSLARFLEAGNNLSVSNLLLACKEHEKKLSLHAFMTQLSTRFSEQGKNATSHHYRTTLNKFSLFQEGKETSLNEINETMMKQFEAWLVAESLAPNTVSFYLRTLRATWNKAVGNGLIDNGPSPFAKVNTRVEKTPKRAVEEKIITKLANLTEKELPSPSLLFARDMFLFSYYARGMSYIDLAFLKKGNIKGNMLVYKRRKTGQELKIRLLPEMKAIINRYASRSRQYLFPILNDNATYRNYESALRLQNKQLKIIGEVVGAVLTTYVARHTWASIANQKGVPIELISKGMGHSSEKVTRIYIALLDNPRMDHANEVVIYGKMNYRKKASWNRNEIRDAYSVSW